MSRVKFPEELVFFNFSFQNFFQFWAKYFQTLAKKTSRSCQIYPLRVQTNNFWLEKFFISFEPFWIFCRKLLHGSQTSICVSRVKIPEEFFFILLFRVFSDFERKFFQTSGQKTSRSFQNYILSVQRNSLWPEFFLSFESLWIFCRNLWHGSQTSIFVSKVKTPEELYFLFFSSVFFRILNEKKFRFSAKKLQEVVKTTLCVVRRAIFGLKILQKFWTVLDFLQKPLAWFSKFYLRVQSKISGRNTFFTFSFQNFFQFWAKIFSFLAKKTSSSCQNYPLRVQTNNFWIEIFFKIFEPFWIFCRNLCNCSQTSIFVSRVKIPEDLYLSFFFSEFFSDFERNFFQTFGQKTSRSFQNYLLSVQRNSLWLGMFF